MVTDGEGWSRVPASGWFSWWHMALYHWRRRGSYWASTCNAARQAYAMLFIDGLVNASAECTYDKDRGYGRSVRLVKDASPSTTTVFSPRFSANTTRFAL